MKYLSIIKKKKASTTFYFSLLICQLFIFQNAFEIIYRKKSIKNQQKIEKRELLSGSQKVEYICEKSDKDLLFLYLKEDNDIIDFNISISMKKSTSYLYNYLLYGKYNNLENYIFTFKYEIFLIIFDFFVIVIWVVLCCIVCKDKWCSSFNNRKKIKFLKKIFLGISILLYFIVILLNIFILLHFYSFIQIINNTFCSLFKISYHVINGQNEIKFGENRPKWIGTNKIKKILQDTKYEINFITDQNKVINDIINKNIVKNKFYYELNEENFVNNHINDFCDCKVPNPNPLCNKNISYFLYCFDILNYIQNEYNNNFREYILDINNIFSEINSIDSKKQEIEISLENAKNKLDSFFKIINDIDYEYFDSLYYIFEKFIHKYLILIFYIFFFFVLLIEIIGILSILSNTCFRFSKYYFNFYFCIWNIQMTLIILTIFITAIFFRSKVLLEDFSCIIKYILTNENIELNYSVTQFNYDINSLNLMMRGDGNLEHYMELDEGAESLIKFYSFINKIEENLRYLKINDLEDKKTTLLLEELEKKPYLAYYKLDDDIENIYINPEKMLENSLSKYTDKEDYQIIGNNIFHPHYYFVYSEDFCKTDYILLYNLSYEQNCYYKEGKYCMVLEDFPYNNYFKNISLNEKGEDIFNNISNLDDLINAFKQRYYENDIGFKDSFIQLLNNSKIYFQNIFVPKYDKLKNSMIKIFEIFDEKINIIYNLYKNMIERNNTNLFSAINIKFLKNDLNIFLNQIDKKLSHSFNTFNNYFLSFIIFSLFCIICSNIVLKLNKIIQNNNEYNIKPTINDIDEIETNFSEKPKKRKMQSDEKL